MNKFRILLGDNDPNFLELTAEYLEDLGYDIVTATSPEEAEAIMQHQRLHLAVLDLRLRNDNDDKDRSGLWLAISVARILPKIILTKFPVHEDVREALKPDSHQLPPAVDFVDKRRGFKELAGAISEVLDQHAQINWSLKILLEGSQTLAQLTQMVLKDLAIEYLSHRVAEMEDLFRKLFLTCSQITIGRLLYRDTGRIIVPVYTYDQDGFSAQYIVSFGQPNIIRKERERFETAVPQPIRNRKIGFKGQQSTSHFTAIAYTFIGGDLETTMRLDDLFDRKSAPVLQTVIENLYESNLLIWYQRRHDKVPQDEFVRFLVNATLNGYSLTAMEEKIAAICKQANKLGNISLEIVGSQLIITDEHPTIHQASAPMALFASLHLQSDMKVERGQIHGCICRNTVLVDEQLKTWLINFLNADIGPLLYDFVTFESMIKFNLLESDRLAARLHCDELMISSQHFAEDETFAEFGQEFDKLIQMVRVARQKAEKIAVCDWQAYQLGLYYAALRFVMQFDIEQRYRRRTLMPFIHALCSAGIIAAQIQKESLEPLPKEALVGLWIDSKNKKVYVEGRSIELTVQDFRIMEYLYEHLGELCERRDIVEEALNEAFDPFDSEQSRLNSAMSRLRHKIEPDPKNPKYLHTIRGRGYELRLR